jgi:hypothetical protein
MGQIQRKISQKWKVLARRRKEGLNQFAMFFGVG